MSYRYNAFTGTLDRVATQGAGGNVEKISDVVPATSSKVVDSVANSSFQSLNYTITAYNDINTQYRFFEMRVLNNSGNYLEDRSNRINAGLDLRHNINNNSGTFELELINNEAFQANVEISRLVC